MLRPKRLGGEGSKEIAAMAALCVARTWIMNKASEYVGALDKNMMTRNQPEFWRLWKASLALATVVSIHRNTYKYFEQSLGLVWQRKLTRMLHDEYFKGSIYCVVCK